MALIDVTTRRAAANVQVAGLDLPPALLGKVTEFLKKHFADDAWAWYKLHLEDVLTTVRIQKKVLWFTVNIQHVVKVKDARWLIEQFAGPEPGKWDVAGPLA